jgi:ParB-like chromosome segregation protein Spo0J
VLVARRAVRTYSAAMTRKIELMPLNQVTGADKNPKKHAHDDISRSIGRFGYVEPVVLDERTGRLVAGHGRIQALRVAQKKGDAPPQGVEERDGTWLVPVLRGWSSRSDTEAQAYLVASNHLTTKGGWENGELVQLLQGLEQQAALEGTGYTSDDIAALLDGLADEAEESSNKAPKSEHGPDNVFQVLVEVDGEDAQADLIGKLEREGFKCRPLVF